MTQMLNGKYREPEAEGIIREAYASVNPAPDDNAALRWWEEKFDRWLESEAADSLYESIVNYRDSSWGAEEMTPADGRVFPGYESLPFAGMPGTGDFNSIYSQGGACSKRMPSSEPQAGLFKEVLSQAELVQDQVQALMSKSMEYMRAKEADEFEVFNVWRSLSDYLWHFKESVSTAEYTARLRQPACN